MRHAANHGEVHLVTTGTESELPLPQPPAAALPGLSRGFGPSHSPCRMPFRAGNQTSTRATSGAKSNATSFKRAFPLGSHLAGRWAKKISRARFLLRQRPACAA
jgi:hypothetical protein